MLRSLPLYIVLLASCAAQPPVQRGTASKPADASLLAKSTKGEFRASANWTVDPITKEDVLQGDLSFLPDSSRVLCEKIGFIQVAKITKENGEDYSWPMGESPRNEMARGGHYVDHLAEHCHRGEPCSPYFADHWPNEGHSAFGHSKANSTAAATMEDFPFGWVYFKKIELEACAICHDRAENLGCLQWGGEWPSAVGTDRTIPTPVFREQPSADFLHALEAFHSFYRGR